MSDDRSPSPSSAGNGRTNLADSPWFWFVLFALMALAALVVVGPRFARRQAQLEQNYQGRRDAWQQRVAPDAQPGSTAR